jgi:hypothetical protein
MVVMVLVVVLAKKRARPSTIVVAPAVNRLKRRRGKRIKEDGKATLTVLILQLLQLGYKLE